MIKILCVGKIKEPYLNELINDYYKRINKYHKLQIIEVKDSNIKNEKELLLKYIDKKDYLIVLDIMGDVVSSKTFAQKIDDIFIHYANITFIIGGSDGLDEEIKQLANWSLSFSRLTFPHGLFRGILLEQIYRIFKINNHESYHK